MARLAYSRQSLDDLGRVVDFQMEVAPESAASVVEAIIEAFAILERHPLVGRRVAGEMRELVISQGATGYLALYRFEAAADVVRVLRIRHQREAGYVD